VIAVVAQAVKAGIYRYIRSDIELEQILLPTPWIIYIKYP